jgi:hypothetical protein
MITIEKQMHALLRRRQEIGKTDPDFNHRWLLEAVELLLRQQLTRSIIASAEFRKVLCEELRKELRNAGILR